MRDKKYPRPKNTAKRSFDLGLFKKKKLEDKVSFRIKMAKKISKHRIRYVSERIGDTDIIIGRDGDFIIRDGIMTVSAGGEHIFKAKISELQASELMSLEGAILTAPDLMHDGKIRTIIAYYVYYR